MPISHAGSAFAPWVQALGLGQANLLTYFCSIPETISAAVCFRSPTDGLWRWPACPDPELCLGLEGWEEVSNSMKGSLCFPGPWVLGRWAVAYWGIDCIPQSCITFWTWLCRPLGSGPVQAVCTPDHFSQGLSGQSGVLLVGESRHVTCGACGQPSSTLSVKAASLHIESCSVNYSMNGWAKGLVRVQLPGGRGQEAQYLSHVWGHKSQTICD